MGVLQVGSTFSGRYRVLHFLAEGGMGSAWVGEDLKSHSLLVFKEPKLMGQPQSDRLNSEKLNIEGYILRYLSHKNIVKFVDLIQVKNIPILVTGFIDGEIIEKVTAARPFEEKIAVKHAIALLEALSYIHSLNIIHRDVRPKNLMLETIGQNLKLIDFGTAKFFYHQLVTPEAIISPGGYSPPEHYKLGYSPQGDIWSAGATLFYLLTGQHPLLVLGRYPRASQPADPRRFRPSISDRVAKVVMKSTQPEPSGRFLTANDMKQQLEGYAPKVYSNPIISLKNQEIPITTSRIVIGRSDDLDSLLVGETVTNSKLDIDSFGEKPAVEVAGDRMNIKVSDPGHYISRMHVEIFQKGQEWFLRDLGSLNGTGVLTETGWQSVHRAHRKEGAPHKLTGKDIISLGYNSVRGPYLVLTFLMD